MNKATYYFVAIIFCRNTILQERCTRYLKCCVWRVWIVSVWRVSYVRRQVQDVVYNRQHKKIQIWYLMSMKVGTCHVFCLYA